MTQLDLRKIATALSNCVNNGNNNWAITKPDNPTWSLPHSTRTSCASGDHRSCEEVFPYENLQGNGLKQKPSLLSEEEWSNLYIRFIDNMLSRSSIPLECFYLGSNYYKESTGDMTKYKHSIKYIKFKRQQAEEKQIRSAKRGSSIDFETPKENKRLKITETENNDSEDDFVTHNRCIFISSKKQEKNKQN